jgi:hypothetical protein
MLGCTWNDSEAEIALRQLQMKEQSQQKSRVDNPKRIKKLRESALARLALKRIVSTARTSETI